MHFSGFLLFLLLVAFFGVVQNDAKGLCPFPPKFCQKCIWKCDEGEKLEISYCGCCENKCVTDEDWTELPSEPSTTVTTTVSTTHDRCADVQCPEAKCWGGPILVAGLQYNGCCPGCVTPNIGDKCYKDLDGNATCGDQLTCFLGFCVKKLEKN